MPYKLADLPQAERLDELFQELQADHSRGSRELSALLLEELLLWSLEIDQITSEQIKNLCLKLTDLRPEMAAIANCGYLLWDRFQEKYDTGSTLPVFREVLRNLRTEEEETDLQLVEHARKASLDDADVMTFSRSSTVLMLVNELESIKKTVVLHSYPGEEGIDTAEDLTENTDVTFAYDMEAGYFLPRVDALYLGVDTLLHDGSIVNKLGSRLLARSAVDTPVRVVTDIYKYTPVDKISINPRYPSPGELAESLQRNHPIFESIPARLIDTYLTNKGCFSNPQSLSRTISGLKRAHERLA